MPSNLARDTASIVAMSLLHRYTPFLDTVPVVHSSLFTDHTAASKLPATSPAALSCCHPAVYWCWRGRRASRVHGVQLVTKLRFLLVDFLHSFHQRVAAFFQFTYFSLNAFHFLLFALKLCGDTLRFFSCSFIFTPAERQRRI
jgi:hypothetical protein